LSHSVHDYENPVHDVQSASLTVALSGVLMPQVGYQLSASYTHTWGDTVQPFFGEIRQDNVISVSALASLARFETRFGRPYVGVEHTISDSSIVTRDYSRTNLRVGFTKQF